MKVPRVGNQEHTSSNFVPNSNYASWLCNLFSLFPKQSLVYLTVISSIYVGGVAQAPVKPV